jgi:hypothetical protein
MTGRPILHCGLGSKCDGDDDQPDVDGAERCRRGQVGDKTGSPIHPLTKVNTGVSLSQGAYLASSFCFT